MNQRKLNLDELRVESFVTSFDAHHDGTVKGGRDIGENQTTIPTRDTPIYTSTGVSTPQLTSPRFTFAEADTGGCQHTDNGCPVLTKI